MLMLRFDPDAELIGVSAHIFGPSGDDQFQLVFDTGAARTEIDRDRLIALGYSEAHKVSNLDIEGVTGPTHQTFSIKLDHFAALGVKRSGFEVAFVDFSRWKKDQIDGLLGWDFVRTLHYEQNGPKDLLSIYS